MDIHAADQDPFFGELDSINQASDDDTASTRTLIADSLRSTSPNPLSIHAWSSARYPSSSSSRQPLLNEIRHDYERDLPRWTDDGHIATPRGSDAQRSSDSLTLNDQGSRTPRAIQEVDLLGEAEETDFERYLLAGERGTHRLDYMYDNQIDRFAESTGPIAPDQRMCQPDAPEPNVRGYNLPADKAMLDTAMKFVDFLPHNPVKPAMLVVVTQDDDTFPIDNLDLDQLEEQCPLLAIGFERNRAGIYKNSLETKSRIIAVSFLRFLHTGSYLVNGDDGVSLVASSLLFHAQMYQMADNFDLTALKQEAQANMTRVTEFACCYPSPPEDLCEASRFIYAHLEKHTNLVGIIQHYCVNCFHNHNLKHNIPFRQLVDEEPLFGLDLLRTNIERGFKDDGAADIIQLPIHTAPYTAKLEAEQLALVDFIYDIWGPRTFASRCGYDSSASSTPSSPRLKGYALVRRNKINSGNYSESSDASASESEGFTLVHRPRPVKASAVINSADEADMSDWSDTQPSDHEGVSVIRRGNLPIRGAPQAPPPSTAVAEASPPPRSRTPTQSNPHPEAGFLSDSSDAEFTLVKRHTHMEDDFDDSDDFEML